jgi:hypothetical protein
MKTLKTLLLITAFCLIALSAEAKEKERTIQGEISQSFEFQGGISNNTGDLAQVNPIVFGRYGIKLEANIFENTSIFAEGGLNGGYTQFQWSRSENSRITQHYFFSPDLRIGLKFDNSIFEPFVFLRFGALTDGGWESDSGIGTTIKIVENFMLVSQLSVESLALTAGIRAGF